MAIEGIDKKLSRPAHHVHRRVFGAHANQVRDQLHVASQARQVQRCAPIVQGPALRVGTPLRETEAKARQSQIGGERGDKEGGVSPPNHACTSQ